MTHQPLFISYARRDDEPFVKKLHADLLRLGYDAWYDRDNMTADGAPFSIPIGDAIRACTHFLLVVGAGSVAKTSYCAGEILLALQLCKPIIPIVRLGGYDLIPDRLKSFHAPDFMDDAKYGEKLTELGRLLGDPIRPLVAIPNVPILPRAHLPREDYIVPLKHAIRSGDPLHVITSRQEIGILTGAGGIGKTTLASTLCHDCDIRRTFTQIFWIPVGPLAKKSDVPALMQTAVGGTSADFDGYEQSRTSFGAHLVGKKTLIVLDDVWATDIAPAFLFSGEDCRLLITTRKMRVSQTLGVSVTPIAVDKLSHADSLTLLTTLAGRTIDQSDQILAQFDGHALAINLAGRWLGNKPTRTGADLLRRLEKTPKFATLTLDDDDKNLNLELALRLSYDELSDSAKAHFRALGIFAPSASVDFSAVCAVWGISDADDAEDALDILVGAGLLDEKTPRRYEQHPLLRAYALALADDHTERPALARAHFDHYHGLHSDHDANNDETRHPAITADMPNIALALAWGFDHAGAGACDWVDALDYYLQLHSTHALRHDWLSRALTVAKTLGDARLQAHALRGLGDVAVRRSEYGVAVGYYEEAAGLYEAVGARLGRANALKGLGDVARMRAEYGVSVGYYEEAAGLYEAVGARLGRANALLGLGDVALMRAEYGVAVGYYEKAAGLYEAVGDRVGRANALRGLGEVARMQHDYPQATTHYEVALALYVTLGDFAGQLNTHNGLAQLAVAQKDIPRAKHHYEALLMLADGHDVFKNHPAVMSWRRAYEALG